MKAWDRMFWAIAVTVADEEPTLIGRSWSNPAWFSFYPGEPSRPLLFTSRALARAWCKEKLKAWRHFPDWNVRPVRVREVVAEVEGQKP